MQLTYLDHKSWLEITREERLFCSHLYHDIQGQGRAHDFVQWLATSEPNGKAWTAGVAPDVLQRQQEWEIAYEVCLYRDLLYSRGLPVKGSGYPQKRTFDLCLFSKDCVVIIEAKVHEGFKAEQVKSIAQDRIRVPQLLKEGVGVDKVPAIVTVALASSIYMENVKTFGRITNPLLDEAFDARVTWKAVSTFLNNPLYEAADKRYHG